jgi:hypothetical protein
MQSLIEPQIGHEAADAALGRLFGDGVRPLRLEEAVFAEMLVDCSVTFEPLPAEVGGYFVKDREQIAINQASPVDHQVRTLIHELAHALIHLTDHEGPALNYAQEELVVECVIFTVVGGLGIDTTGYSIPYLASWSQDDDEAMQIIETCAGLIDHHAKRLEDAIGQPDDF